MPGASVLSTKIIAESSRFVSETRNAENATRRLSRRIGELNNRGRTVGQTFTAVRSAILPVTAAITAAAAAAAGAVRHSARYEVALVGLGKTSGLTGRSLEALGDRLDDTAIALGASREEILGLAQIAAQLGVSGADNLENFSRVIFQLADASDLTGENAAILLQRFLTLSNLPTSEVGRLSDVIVALGNNMAVAESELSNMLLSLRQGSIGVELSIEFMGALAATTAESGIQAESARTSFQKLLISIQSLVDEGGQGLAALAETMELNVERARELFAQSPEAFIARLFETAGDLRSQDYNRLLRDLDQEGARGRVFFGAGVSAAESGNLREALGLANDAEGSRQREAFAARDTLQGQINSTLTRFAVEFSRITDTVAPDLVSAFALLAEALGKGIDFVSLLGDGISLLLPDLGTFGRTIREIVFGTLNREDQLRAAGVDNESVSLSTQLLNLLGQQRRERESLAGNRQELEEIAERTAARLAAGIAPSDQEAVERDARRTEALEALIAAQQGQQITRQGQIDALRDILTPIIAPSSQTPAQAAAADARTEQEETIQRALAAYENSGRTREAQFIRDQADLRAEGASPAALEELQITRQIADLQDKIAAARLTGDDEVIQRLDAELYAANRRLETSQATLEVERQIAAAGAASIATQQDPDPTRHEEIIAVLERQQAAVDAVVSRWTALGEAYTTAAEAAALAAASIDESERRNAEAVARGREVHAELATQIEERNKQIADSLAENVAGPLRALLGGGSFTDALQASLRNLAAQILEMGAIRPIVDSLSNSLQGLFSAGAGGGGGGFLSGLFGGGGGIGSIIGSLFGGGGGAAAAFAGIPYLQDGGRVTRDTLAVVGENGPEVVSLRQNDMVFPNGAMPRGGGVNVSFSLNFAVSAEDRISATVQEQIPLIKDVIEQSIEGRFNNPMDSLSLAARGA